MAHNEPLAFAKPSNLCCELLEFLLCIFTQLLYHAHFT